MSGLFGGGTKASSNTVVATTLNIQQSIYGTPIKRVYGTNRISGNLIWYGDFNAVQQSQSGGGGKGGGGGGGGGKGGGGGGSYNYYASYMIGLCEGPISGIGTVWESKNITSLSAISGAFFNGATGQAPWGFMSSNHNSQALGYTNLSYVGFANANLGTSPNTPNYGFEVKGMLISQGADAQAEAVISDFLPAAQFPSAYIGSFAQAATYWTASSFFISPIVDQQRKAADYLNEWMATLNAEYLWSNGVLSIVPYGDTQIAGNGATYIPNFTPIYALTDDDLIRDGDNDPITVTRTDLSDAYNQQPVEYNDNTNAYNTATLYSEDSGCIDQFGLRAAGVLTCHHVTNSATAQAMADNVLRRNLYVRKTYAFKLSWRFFLLDPMDYVTLTDATLGLNNELVRITKIEEDEAGMLSITAEEVPGSIASAPIFSTQASNGFSPNLNVAAGNTNAPIIFEVPLALMQSATVELWLVLSGLAPWGGADIWTSTDGNSYSFLQRFIGNGRQGVLTAPLAASSAYPDITDTLAVDLTMSGATLSTPSNNDALNLNTLAYVDGELVAYGAATLTAANKYNLTYLVRGAYGTTAGSHASGSQFARLDLQVVKLLIDQKRIGQKIYIKAVGFNYFGGGEQDISTVQAYAYTVTGSALLTALPNPTALTVNYTSKIAQLNWTGVSDLRSPIYYEIRQGTTWANSQVVERTPNQSMPVPGSGTYWVSALYFTPLGVAVYSSSPVSIAVTAPSLVDNIIAAYDEAATGFGGTCSGGAIVVGSNVVLGGSGNILADANILLEGNVLFLGGVAASGTYTAPAGHTIISANITNAKINISWNCYAQNILDNVLTNPNILGLSDLLGQQYQSLVYAQPQIRLSQDGSTWGAWQNWEPGVYTFLQAQAQIILYSADVNVQAILSGFTFSADVGALTYTGTTTSSASVTVTVNYPITFNVTPLPQLTIQNAVAGDDIILTAQSAFSFTYKILNAGVQVTRVVNWSATAY